MRRLVAAAVAVAMIGCATALAAAPADIAAQQNATPIVRAVQVSYWGNWYYGGYRPACPWGYHYACPVGPYGYRQCTCWPDW